MKYQTKRLIAVISVFLIAIALLLPIFAHAESTEDCSEVNYLYLMEAAAVMGDAETGLAEESARDAKIDREGLNYQHILWEDLYYLSKIMYSEAGSVWLSDEWKMAVGEVVLNRVASPKFPDTVKEVVFQQGQYSRANSTYFHNLRPNMRCVELALRLLQGERVLNNPDVLYQSNEPQGSGTYRAYHDKLLGWTYFCLG
jgi:hypothetical protein